MPDRLRVLVVEDTDHVRRMLTSMLELDGFAVTGAASGADAIRAASAEPADVVVLDLRMPDMDGLEAARRIREVRPEQAMVLYTAFVDGEVEARALDAGISACVGKVDGVAALEREIRRLTGRAL